MKKILSAALVAAVGAIGIAACDAESPPETAVSRPAESEAIAEPRAIAEPEAIAEPQAIAEPEAIAARKALAAVMREADPFVEAQKLGALLSRLGPEAVPAVEEALEDPAHDFRATEVELLLRFWASHQPMEASRWAALKSPWNHRPAAILASFTSWAEEDPETVRNALHTWGMQPSNVRNAMQIALVRGWFKANPSELARFMKDLGMGYERQRVVAAYIRALIKAQGPDAVVSWAESLPDDDATYKTAVYRQVGAALPMFDHDASLGWCEAHCDGPYGNNLRNIIARRWVLHDGAAALAWLSGAPESHEKKVALRSAFAVWAQADRDAALAWMAAQTTGEPEPWLRPIYPIYAPLLAEVSPAEAIVWAERIEADDAREIGLIQVVQAWREVDEAAAEAWLLQSPLSEEAREKARAPQPESQQRGPGG